MSIKQWEIWNVNFNPSKGHEIQKVRPCIVINDQRVGKLKLKIIIPITDVGFPKSWHVPIKANTKNKLSKDSHADCFQLKSVSDERFLKKIGVVDEAYRSRLQFGVLLVLGIEIV